MPNPALVGLECGMLPAVTMSLGAVTAGWIGRWITQSTKAATQYLSAGIIIGVVVGEIFPLLDEYLTDAWTGLGLIGGFAGGIFFNARNTREDDDSDDDESDESDASTVHGDDASELGAAPSINDAGFAAPQRRMSETQYILGTTPPPGPAVGDAPRDPLRVPQQFETLEDVLDAIAPNVFADGPPVPRLLDVLTREARARGDRDAFDHAIHELEFVLHTLRRALRRRRDGQRRDERGAGANRFSAQEVDRLQCHIFELKKDFDRLRAVPTGGDAVGALKDVEGTLEHIHGHVERPFRRWAITPMAGGGHHSHGFSASPPEHSSSSEDSRSRHIGEYGAAAAAAGWGGGGGALGGGDFDELMRRRASSAQSSDAISRAPPRALVTSVTLDAVLDGFLIGLTAAISPEASLAMSVATCLEMGVLGVSYALAIAGHTNGRIADRRAVLALVVPPSSLLATACAGGALGLAVMAAPALFVAFLSFAGVSLLFMVTQELLVEAREADEGQLGEKRTLGVAWLFGGALLTFFLSAGRERLMRPGGGGAHAEAA